MDNIPYFDNIVVSKNIWGSIVEKAVPSDLSDPASALIGVRIVVSRWMPDDTMLLRLGNAVVAIIQPDKHTKELDEFYKQKLAELVKNRPAPLV